MNDWQPYAWLVVRIPYGDREHADRDDLDDAIMDAVRKALAEVGAEHDDVKLFDHVGVAEWIYEALQKGLVVEESRGRNPEAVPATKGTES